MKRSSVFLIILILSASIAAYGNSLCCIYIWDNVQQEVESRRQSSSLIFSGEVIAIKNVHEPSASEEPAVMFIQEWLDWKFEQATISATFRVDKYWKGGESDIVQILTLDRSKLDGGYPFVVGGRYVVFADDWKGKPGVGSCSLVRRFDAANDVLPLLGTGKKPAALPRK